MPSTRTSFRTPESPICHARHAGGQLERLGTLFRELREEPVDDTLFNIGLSYLLVQSWQAFRDSDDIVGGASMFIPRSTGSLVCCTPTPTRAASPT